MTTKKQVKSDVAQETAEENQQTPEKGLKSASASTAKTANAEGNDEILQKLESLSEIFQASLGDIDQGEALESIDEWHSLVHKSKEPAFKEIASGLKELQKLLKRDDAGHDLGELLNHLGEQTSDIAAHAEKEFKAPLQNLGKQLVKAGQSLAKEEDQQQIAAIETLVETLDQEVETIDPKATAGDIDHWYTFLHKSDDESLQAIASDLKELKQLLKGSKSKSAELSEKLVDLGEQTVEAASIANRGFKGTIKKLGKTLTRLGKSIA